VELVYVYQPAQDVAAAAAFYRDRLGYEETWRDGTDTVAFQLPGSSAQLMVSTTPQPPGLMFRVEDVVAWASERPELTVAVPRFAIPGGSVLGLDGPEGSVFYVYDQPGA